MKKLLLSCACILYCLVAFSQTKLDDSTYKTRKGELIKRGDTLTLGVGSLPSGDFNYVYEVSTMGGNKNVPKLFSNEKLLVYEVTGGGKIKVWIKCKFINKKNPWVAVDPDAAITKEEIYLPVKD